MTSGARRADGQKLLLHVARMEERLHTDTNHYPSSSARWGSRPTRCSRKTVIARHRWRWAARATRKATSRPRHPKVRSRATPAAIFPSTTPARSCTHPLMPPPTPTATAGRVWGGRQPRFFGHFCANSSEWEECRGAMPEIQRGVQAGGGRAGASPVGTGQPGGAEVGRQRQRSGSLHAPPGLDGLRPAQVESVARGDRQDAPDQAASGLVVSCRPSACRIRATVAKLGRPSPDKAL